MGNNTTTLGEWVGVSSAKVMTDAWKVQWMPELASQTRTVRMLRVTAVLMADDDGGRATGIVKQGGSVFAKDGLLRDPAIHTKLSENFIDDWVSLANKQLFASGADFLLDRTNVRYVLVKNTLLNSYGVGADTQPVLDFIAAKKKGSADNPWRDSVLLLFPWGSAAPADEGGFSDVVSPFIKMPAKAHDFDTAPRFVDGDPVPGNNILTHELGHFLGLPHNFPQQLQDRLNDLAFTQALNPRGFALNEKNIGEFNGIVKSDIPALRSEARKLVATWRYDLEQDNGEPHPELFPPELDLLLTDTPINLGMGLPAVMGDRIGGNANLLYNLEWFTDMTVTPDSAFGTPKGDGKPITIKVPVNKDVRLNVMSYWYSSVFAQRFTKRQVARMKHAVDTFRGSLVSRTVSVSATVKQTGLDVTENAFSLPPMMLQSPESVKLAIRKPTQRQIESELARVRRPSTTRPRRLPVPDGNSCSLHSKPLNVRLK